MSFLFPTYTRDVRVDSRLIDVLYNVENTTDTTVSDFFPVFISRLLFGRPRKSPPLPVFLSTCLCYDFPVMI